MWKTAGIRAVAMFPNGTLARTAAFSRPDADPAASRDVVTMFFRGITPDTLQSPATVDVTGIE